MAKPWRVDLGGRRREQDVGAGVRGQAGVALLVARVGAEVGGVLELGRVDEQRHDDDVARRARLRHEREVPVVQGAHGRHEPDAAAVAARGRKRGAQVGDGAQGLHARLARDPALPAAARRRSRRPARRRARGPPARARRPPRAGAATVSSSPRAIGPVSAVGRSGGGPVLDARAHERDERLAVDARRRGEALRDALDRDEEVRGDAGGGVVGGAVLVGDVDGPHPERARELLRGGERARRRAGDRGRRACEASRRAAARS